MLTYLLQLLAERGILEKLAFKGGTCLRKMFIGAQGRFSTDLDFTAFDEHDHEEVILGMMAIFEEPFHGIRFSIPDDSYYETQDGLSWGVNPAYEHGWNAGGDSTVKLQISKRETPTLNPVRREQCRQNYFRYLPFAPVDISCLALPEIIAEKIRACYQRSKARDVYDLGMFAVRPLDRPLIRRLAILKLWQVGDTFDPAVLMAKFENKRAFDWNDLSQLVHRDRFIDPSRIVGECLRGFAFLTDMTEEERLLAADRYRRERTLWELLGKDISES